jgi:hypothetical protein
MTPYVINLTADPKDRKPYDFPYMHSWTGVHFGKILKEYAESVQRDPLIPGRGTAKSGHALLHCICLLLTQSRHQRRPLNDLKRGRLKCASLSLYDVLS